MKKTLITQEEINTFIRDWGQNPSEIKNNQEEIYDFEIEVDDDFIIGIGNYFFSESQNIWVTIDNESSQEKVFKYLDLLRVDKKECNNQYELV